MSNILNTNSSEAHVCNTRPWDGEYGDLPDTVLLSSSYCFQFMCKRRLFTVFLALTILLQQKDLFLFHFNLNFISIIFLDESYGVCKIQYAQTVIVDLQLGRTMLPIVFICDSVVSMVGQPPSPERQSEPRPLR